MARKKSATRGKKAFSSGTPVERNALTGRFVLGRAAFESISEVEGIRLSKSMGAALHRTEAMPADQRRSALASKYGKK